MYTLVRRYIKTAIGFLIVGLLIGSWMLLQREFGPRIVTPYQTSAHTHAIFVGFVMMMICGVSLWLFPRPDKSDRQYRPGFVQAAYWMLTVGTAVRIAGELLRPSLSAPLWLRVGIVNGGLLQVIGLTLFFYTMWSRIRAVGSQTREAKGERF